MWRRGGTTTAVVVFDCAKMSFYLFVAMKTFSIDNYRIIMAIEVVNYSVILR